MNPSYARLVVTLAVVALYAIRLPYAWRSLKTPVQKRAGGPLESVSLTFAKVGFALPVLWVLTPLLSFADYPPSSVRTLLGAPLLLGGLWLFYRSHADLGVYWSVTLELKENHRLTTSGVYRRVRHPMYTGCLIYAVGLAIALPNWLAGPAFGVSMLLLVLTRMVSEERMLEQHFGDAYRTYQRRTWRLIPWVW